MTETLGSDERCSVLLKNDASRSARSRLPRGCVGDELSCVEGAHVPGLAFSSAMVESKKKVATQVVYLTQHLTARCKLIWEVYLHIGRFLFVVFGVSTVWAAVYKGRFLHSHFMIHMVTYSWYCAREMADSEGITEPTAAVQQGLTQRLAASVRQDREMTETRTPHSIESAVDEDVSRTSLLDVRTRDSPRQAEVLSEQASVDVRVPDVSSTEQTAPREMITVVATAIIADEEADTLNQVDEGSGASGSHRSHRSMVGSHDAISFSKRSAHRTPLASEPKRYKKASRSAVSTVSVDEDTGSSSDSDSPEEPTESSYTGARGSLLVSDEPQRVEAANIRRTRVQEFERLCFSSDYEKPWFALRRLATDLGIDVFETKHDWDTLTAEVADRLHTSVPILDKDLEHLYENQSAWPTSMIDPVEHAVLYAPVRLRIQDSTEYIFLNKGTVWGMMRSGRSLTDPITRRRIQPPGQFLEVDKHALKWIQEYARQRFGLARLVPLQHVAPAQGPIHVEDDIE